MNQIFFLIICVKICEKVYDNYGNTYPCSLPFPVFCHDIQVYVGRSISKVKNRVHRG